MYYTSVTPAEHQWEELKQRKEKATGAKFPGYICSEDLLLLLISLGYRISAVEARELVLIIAPGKNSWQNGKIEQKELIAFTHSSCRLFGELDKILEKDMLAPLIAAYKEHRDVVRTNGETSEHLLDTYEGIMHEISEDVRTALNPADLNASGPVPPSTPTNRGVNGKAMTKPTNMKDVYSITELKTGIEKAMAAYLTAGIQFPTLEEWAFLGCRFGAIAVENDVYGIRIPAIFEAICEALVGNLHDFHPTEKVSLEPLRRDLRKMIEDEAKRLAGYGKAPDYEGVFKIFDGNRDNRISNEEFRATLVRFKILGNLPDAQVDMLIALFDTANKGYIEYPDFLKFMDLNKYAEDTHEQFEDDEELNGAELSLSSNTPPTSITKNPDCDWLLWLLWKEATKIDPSDPEAVITELEGKCHKTQLPSKQGSMRMIDLWKTLVENKVKGNLTKSQYAKCILYLVDNSPALDGKQVADDGDIVDYDSLFRYVIRMGRSHSNIVSERQASEDKLYKLLLPVLKRELMLMIPVEGPSSA